MLKITKNTNNTIEQDNNINTITSYDLNYSITENNTSTMYLLCLVYKLYIITIENTGQYYQRTIARTTLLINLKPGIIEMITSEDD